MKLLLLAILVAVASAALPTPVVNCGTYTGGECNNQGDGCVGAGWYSKDNTVNPNQRVNADQICKDEGYTGADTTQYGGNWGHQCRFPGTNKTPNKAGGALTSFGYTVTWKCAGTLNTSPVVDCGDYDGAECKDQGDGCVGEGWFSKDNTVNPHQRVNAEQICKDNGFSGADPNQYGGNWGHQCRYPGTNGTPNKAGGALTSFGYTVSWKCVGGTVTYPPIPTPVVDCGAYEEKGTSRECNGQGSGCVGEGWYSKDNVSNPNQRIDAQKVCKDQGYAQGADPNQYGGNWGHQCRYPGTKPNFNKAGGALTALGYTVTWKCQGPRTGGSPTAPPTAPPTPAPTPAPTASADVMDVVVDCGDYDGGECKDQGDGCVGDGWFSKDNTVNPFQRVDAEQICKDNGFTGADPNQYGGNWGHQCRFPGTNGTPNKAGGALTSFGYTVSWKCIGGVTYPPLPTPVVDCGAYEEEGTSRECNGQGSGCVGEGWYSKDNVSNPNQRIDAQKVCKDQGYAQGADPNQYGGNWGHQCRYPGTKPNFNKAGGALTALGYTVTWKCQGPRTGGSPTAPPTAPPTPAPTASADVMDVVVDCGDYDGGECKDQGDGCVGDGWFSKDNTVNPFQRVDAEQICKDNGFTGADPNQYGGNWGHQCRFPGTNGTPNKAGGALTSFGYTVSWKCVGGTAPTAPPTKNICLLTCNARYGCSYKGEADVSECDVCLEGFFKFRIKGGQKAVSTEESAADCYKKCQDHDCAAMAYIAPKKKCVLRSGDGVSVKKAKQARKKQTVMAYAWGLNYDGSCTKYQN